MALRKILANAIMGFEFEFYTNYSYSKLLEVINNEMAPNIKVHGFRKYHSDMEPTDTEWKIEPDMSGGPNMVELVTGPMEYDQAKINVSRVLGFLQRHAFTNDHCSLHINLSYKDGSEKQISGLSPLKLIMTVDEDSIYRDFPKREGSIYAKSVKRILPEDGLQYVDRQEVLERSLKLPKTKYYGVNFSHPDRLEFRYVGGKDYQHKAGRISQLIDDFFLLMWNSTNVPLTEGEMDQLRHKLDQNWQTYGTFSTLDNFIANWPGVKVQVDQQQEYEVLRHYWPQFKDRLHDLLTCSSYGEQLIVSYVSEKNKLEIFNAVLDFQFPLSGLDYINCTIKGLTAEKSNFIGCDVDKSNLQKCNLWDTTVTQSQLHKCDVNAGTVLKKCFFSSGYMDGQMEGGVIRSGQLGPSAYVARNVKKTTQVSIFGKTDDKKKKKAFDDNVF